MAANAAPAGVAAAAGQVIAAGEPLAVRGLVAGYGGQAVLHGVSFAVAAGEAVAMVGLNGAGKSVTMRCVAGLLKPWKGTVELGDRDITRLSPEARVGLGLATVPQGRGIFGGLSVEQNLRLGGYSLSGREYAGRAEATYARFPKLHERRRQAAGTLSGGEQATLAVARALIGRPRLLLLDEPTAGLSPVAARELLELLRGLSAEGVTILLVEQNIGIALKLVDRVLLMQKGTIARAASPASLTDRRALLADLGAGALYDDSRRPQADGGGGAPPAANDR
ncbi:MAG TPA: ABC transporter ATP-binding protein [Candidatus Dormibacteraeota bacterium]|nr:ABC transporter ATP-binding protein [Candidatus Dormibacteraeota bacterium]